MNYRIKKINKGMATIELLVAFAILLINVTSVVLLVQGGQSLSLDSETNQEALAKAEQQIEKAKADARLDFNLVNDISPTSDDIYNKSLLVTYGEDDSTTTNFDESLVTKLVTSIVNWNISISNNKEIKLVTKITNPDAVDGGDTCSSILEGDWTNPEITSYLFGDQILGGGDPSSGFPITSIQSFNHKLYVTINHDNGNNSGTFYILDITNPGTIPTPLGWLDNSSSTEKGLNAVAVDGGNYAYVANANNNSGQNCVEGHNCAQLQIINISNPNSPNIIKNFKIPSLMAGNKLAYGTSIFYENGIIYLGLAKAQTSYNEFFVIDVNNPLNPIILDSEKIGAGVNSIIVKDGYAYVASPDDYEVRIFDVSNPSSITFESKFDAPANGIPIRGHGKSLAIVGNKLYVGTTFLENQSEFFVLNNTNPTSDPVEITSMEVYNEDNPDPEDASVNGLIIRNNLAMLVTKKEFQIWDLTDLDEPYSDPIVLPPGTGGPNLEGTATDCEGNYIYVGSLGPNDKGYISVITGGN